MKIKELENILSISRSNIRFYEKQGLFSPERKDNNYREYTEQDIQVLKEIIIYRKMGFTVEEIKLIQNNELPFSEAMANVQQRIEDEIEQLNGSLELIKQVSQENASFDEIDIDEQWNKISKSEKLGEKFVDICKDFLALEFIAFDLFWMSVFFEDFKESKEKYGTITVCGIFLLISVLRGIVQALVWKESFWYGFLYPFMVVFLISVTIILTFLLYKKFPKVASTIVTIILVLSILVLVLILLPILYAIIYSIIT